MILTPNSFFFALLLFIAVFSKLASAIMVDCDTLQTVMSTVNELYSDSFQLSSINLNSYYIPSYINSVCGIIEDFGNLTAILNFQ